jgi:hypothetical protein
MSTLSKTEVRAAAKNNESVAGNHFLTRIKMFKQEAPYSRLQQILQDPKPTQKQDTLGPRSTDL